MKILYFASLKEALNCASEDIDLPQDSSVQQLRSLLVEKHGAKHFPDNILCAVNQAIASDDLIVREGDEVAFYPPVTGG